MNAGLTCAFVPCDQVVSCCLVGGCVKVRFPQPRQVRAAGELPKRQALNGTKPARFGKVTK